MEETVIVLDFGGQYNQLIARRVREQNVYCELLPCTTPVEKLLAKQPKGIIFTGGPNSVYGENAPRVDRKLLEAGIPVLGICYGCQLIAHTLGGKVQSADTREYGKQEIRYKASPLFAGIPEKAVCWMSHTDRVTEVPGGFEVLADTETCSVAAMGDAARKIYGVQFHPEVMHTQYGTEILRNFLYNVCGVRGLWTMKNFAEKTIESL